ncbi:MAG: LPS export ABC transporter permease LptF [Nitrospirae bacterium]|nr:LPS export ABC transporter permease LptF [Nitrospirota bacterium]
MFRPRIVDRYIFLEMLPPFFLSMAVLLFVLFLQKLFRLADLVVSKGATLADTAEVLAYVVPGFLVITIPMSLVVASLTTFARLSSDSEITAMKASRISLYRMIRPVFLFALIAFSITAFTSLFLVPGANSALKARLFSMVKSRALIGIEPGVFSSTFEGMVLYVDKMDPQDNLEGVFISDERSAREPFAIVAKRGKLIADQQAMNVTLAMQDGAILTQPRAGQAYSLMGFDNARLNLDISSALQNNAPGKSVDDFDTLELFREIRRLRREGKPSYVPETELHKRLSIPFACIILGLIGAPLGIRRSRSGKSAGVAVALLVFLVYFIILSGATNLAETGTYPAFLAFWIPNSLMTVSAIFFIIKRGQEINFGIGRRISRLYYGIKARLKGKT